MQQILLTTWKNQKPGTSSQYLATIIISKAQLQSLGVNQLAPIEPSMKPQVQYHFVKQERSFHFESQMHSGLEENRASMQECRIQPQKVCSRHHETKRSQNNCSHIRLRYCNFNQAKLSAQEPKTANFPNKPQRNMPKLLKIADLMSNSQISKFKIQSDPVMSGFRSSWNTCTAIICLFVKFFSFNKV